MRIAFHNIKKIRKIENEKSNAVCTSPLEGGRGVFICVDNHYNTQMCKKQLCTLLFTLFSLLSFSQSLSGTITDRATHTPLIGADVYIQELQKGTSTDNKGFYTLKNIPAGSYTLRVSYIGYKAQKRPLRVSGETVLNLALEEETQSIDEVVVSAKAKARAIKEQAMPITVIDMASLRGTTSNVQDIIAKTVGVTLRSTGGVGSAARISVRGLEGKRIGFFIDDFPMGEQSDYVDINDIPVDMIDRIEIYKGVVPARFGGSAMGGAVNIVLREYPSRYADLSYTLERFNTHKAQAVFKRSDSKRGLLLGIGGVYASSDNDYEMEIPNRQGLKVRRNHDAYRKYMVGGSFKAKKWYFNEIEVEPIYVRTYKEVQGIEHDVREAHSYLDMLGVVTKFEKEGFLTDGLSLTMYHNFASLKANVVDKAQRIYQWDGSSYPSTSHYGGELGLGYASDSDDRKLTYANRINLEYILSEQHSLNLNSQFNYAKGEPHNPLKELSMGKQTDFDSDMYSWVAGLSYDYRDRTDHLLNSLSARYYNYHLNTRKGFVFGSGVKDIDLHKSDFGFSDALRYRFLPTLMEKVSAGYEVRIPSENELLGDGVNTIAAEELLPERNLSANLGVLYDLTGAHATNAQIELNFFYMQIEDVIRFTQGVLGSQYQNFGQMRTIGVEFDAKADLSPSLYGYLNTTYQDLRDIRQYEQNSTVPNPTKGKRMPNIPYLLANAGLEYHRENLFGGTGQNTRLMLDAAFIEEYYYDFELTQLDKRRIPRNLTLDVGFEHSFKHQHLFLSGKVRNLTDQKVVTEFNRPLPGLSWAVKLRVIF